MKAVSKCGKKKKSKCLLFFRWGTTYGTFGFALCFGIQTSHQLEMGLKLPDHCGSNWGRYLRLRII